jgi:hypothetical protein
MLICILCSTFGIVNWDSSRHSDLLWSGRSGDQVWVAAKISEPTQTRPGTQSIVQCVPGVVHKVKRPRRGVDHPTRSSPEVEESIELYLYSLSGPSWPVLG